MTLTVGSLFSGIGGLDLGLERAGMVVRWQSEIDPYACRVLARHWPDVPNLGDISTIDWSSVPHVDLICGGYPCQPFSTAGRRAGENDARHLWPYFADAIRHLRPDIALLENVPGHLSLGFGRVLGDLAELGFDADWQCVSAAEVGAPHLRRRVFVVAHARSPRHRTDSRGLPRVQVGRRHRQDRFTGRSGDGTRPADDAGPDTGSADADVPDPDSVRRDRRTGKLWQRRWPEPQDSGWWAAEPEVGRVAHGVPGRVGQLTALGNAVVPQVAEHLGRLILERYAETI